MRIHLLLLSLVLALWLAVLAYHPTPVPASCRFTAYDIGQGDAILVQTSDKQDILIDGGPNDDVARKLGRSLGFGNRDIELMVLTHPHADHVNGLVDATERFRVKSVLTTGVQYQQLAYKKWLQEVEDQRSTIHIAQTGKQFKLGLATVDVLWPAQPLDKTTIEKDDASHGGGVNDASVVFSLRCAGSDALLMGDASFEIEEAIVASRPDLDTDLLKVGHHGSRYSSSIKFLEVVKPEWAVISSGEGNRYNHPHPIAVQHLEQSQAALLRTDQLGDVVLETDGHGGWRKFQKPISWIERLFR